jgi:hypothetical protein
MAPSPKSQTTKGMAASTILRPPYVDDAFQLDLLNRAGALLTLALAQYLFGATEQREKVDTKPTERLNRGKPRKNQSLFAVTRLSPPRKCLKYERSWHAGADLKRKTAGDWALQISGPWASLVLAKNDLDRST